MHLTVLAVPGCPNAALLEEQLANVLEGRPGVNVSRHVIADEAAAASRGMHGSPTLLINGADPFAEPGQSASLSCRLYRGSDGRISGVPSAGQLRQAIERAADSDDEAGSPSWLDALGRGGRGRIAPAERGLRAVHQAVLRSFARTGSLPETSLLEDAAAPSGAAQALAELADGDFLCLDDAGRITAAYPFSALPTAHRVQIAGGASAYAMCAIDALGIAPMLDGKAVIQSADPSTGQPITVSLDGSNSEWHPRHCGRVRRPRRQRGRRAVSDDLLRIHELLCHPGSRSRLGSRASRDHRRHLEPGPRHRDQQADLRPAAPIIKTSAVRAALLSEPQQASASRGASSPTRRSSSVSTASKLPGSPAATGSGTDQCTAAAVPSSSCARSHTVTSRSPSSRTSLRGRGRSRGSGTWFRCAAAIAPGVDCPGGVGAGRGRRHLAGPAPQRRRQVRPGRVGGAHEQHPPCRQKPRTCERVQCARHQPQVRAPPVTVGTAAGDKPCLFKHAQVMGEQVRRHRQHRRQLGRRGVPGAERVGDPQARGVGQRRMHRRPARQTGHIIASH